MQQSNVPHIYAVGDCADGRALASLAIKQGKVAAEVLSGQRVQFAPLVTPLVIHTIPELATAGFSADEATRAGYNIVTGRFPLAARIIPSISWADKGSMSTRSPSIVKRKICF